ncbi:MAG: hypothetical protein P8Y42_21790 [Exilibacterium sp.]
MNSEKYEFKGWVAGLNASLLILCIWLVIAIYPSVVKNISEFEKIENLYLPIFCVAIIWLAVCEFGYNILLYLPKGVALELNPECIRVCTPFGLKEIPRKAVKGCKNPVHRMSRRRKSGLVIISVSPECRVVGPHGFKVNPRFHGASVVGEDEQTMVKKIRTWRKYKSC